MKAAAKNKVFSLLISLIISMTLSPLYAMEGEIIEEGVLGSLVKQVGEAGGENARNLLQEVTETSLGSDLDTLEQLPQGAKEEFVNSIQEEVINAAKQFKAGTLTESDFQAMLQKSVNEGTQKVISNIDELVKAGHGFSAEAKEAMLEIPGLKSTIGDGSSLKEIPEAATKPVGVETAKPITYNSQGDQTAISSDKVIVGEKKLIEVSATGDVTNINRATEDLTQLKSDFETKSSAYADQTKKAVSTNEALADQAATNLSEAGTEGNATKINQAETDAQKALKDLDDADTDDELQKRQSSKEKYRQAKEEYETLKSAKQEEWDTFKKENAEKSFTPDELKARNDAWNAKAAEYDKQIEAAREELSTATKEYIEKGSWKDVDRLKVIAKKQVISGVTAKVKWGAEFAFSGLANWAFFTVPSMVIEAFEAATQKQALLNTIRSMHTFGGIMMKIPSDFINSGQPQASKFIYVGLDSKDQKITPDLLKNGHYYVALSNYGDLAQFSITDPNFPNQMLDLKTGYVFLGDGQPVDQQEPSLQLLGSQATGAEQPIKSSITLQDALQDVASIAGGQKTEDVQNYFDITTEGSKGNQIVIGLMESKENQIPPILQSLVTSLQSGGQFGSFQLRGIEALTANQITLLEQQNANLPESERPLTFVHLDNTKNEIRYPIASGIYIYQTGDTEFAKMMRSQIKKGSAQDQLLHESLSDYVIVVGDTASPQLTPLLVPSIRSSSGQSQQPGYFPNPDAKYLISLIDPEVEIIDANQQITSHAVVYAPDGTIYSGVGPSIATLDGLIQQPFPDWYNQIKEMRSYFEKHILYGPFKIGAQTLAVLNTALIDAPNKLPIYQVPDFLEDGSDDFVISIIKTNAGALPSLLPRRLYIEDEASQSDRQLFVSLVTSRFYDGSMLPLIIRDPKTGLPTAGINYYIVQNPDGTQRVTTSLPAGGGASAGKAQLYTLFVDEAFNPNTPAGGKLPTGQQWALKNMKVFDRSDDQSKAVLISVQDYFAKYALTDGDVKQLQDAIEKSYDAWKVNNDNKYPADVDRQMGPFTWIEGVQPVQLMATSADDIKQNVYVYTSPSYPDQYLVLSDSQTVGGTPAFNTTSPQRYAISLSSGQVYDRQAGGASVKEILDFNSLLVNAQSSRKFSAVLLNNVQQSQIVFTNRVRQFLYGPDVVFGSFQFYVNYNDFVNGQYIYADVTNLGDPLNADGITENPTVASKITDYFVLIARTPKQDASGNVIPNQYDYDFGIQLGAPVKPGTDLSVASLVTGAAFNRVGFLGSYNQFAGIQEQGVAITGTDLASFSNNVLDIIAKKAGLTSASQIRLYPVITKLTAAAAKLKAQELAQIAQDEQEEAMLFQPLPDNVLQNILTAPAVTMNPNMPRAFNLKLSGGKYYALTAAPENTGDPAQTIIDYNFNPAGAATNDTGRGMIWQVVTKDGATIAEPKLLLSPLGTDANPQPGWALQVARAYAGVAVDPQTGKQSLTLGISVPSLPMMIKKGTVSTSALVDTGLSGSTTIQSMGQFVMAPGLTQAAGLTLQLKMYFNMLTNTYFMSVVRPDKSNYYVELQSGFCYDWDGQSEVAGAHIGQTPVYQNSKGNILLIGADEYNTLKIVFNNPYLGTAYQPYTLSSIHDPEGGIIFGQIRAKGQTMDLGNMQGSLYNLTNDYDLSEIQVGYLSKDAAGNPLPSATSATQPSYVIWNFNPDINTLTFIDQYTPVKDTYYSLLIYQQTRQAGAAITTGQYVDADNMHQLTVTIDPDTGSPVLANALTTDASQETIIERMSIVGIIFNGNKTFKSLYYKNQLIPLTGGGTGPTKTYNGTYQDIGADNKPVNRPVVVTLAPYTFPNTDAQTMLVSITDGNKTYDYLYDFKILNVTPLIDPSTATVEFDLYSTLQNWKWPTVKGIDQSQFIPNIHAQSKSVSLDGNQVVPNSPINTFASTALVGPLPLLLSSAPAVTCPPQPTTCVQAELKPYLDAIKVAQNTNIYIPFVTKTNKAMTSYLYRLGNSWDSGKSYYPTLPGSSKSYVNNWYVNLSNGILYMPGTAGWRPAGFALLPSQLAELLDTINLSVQVDQDGYPTGLQFRGFNALSAAPAQ